MSFSSTPCDFKYTLMSLPFLDRDGERRGIGHRKDLAIARDGNGIGGGNAAPYVAVLLEGGDGKDEQKHSEHGERKHPGRLHPSRRDDVNLFLFNIHNGTVVS